MNSRVSRWLPALLVSTALGLAQLSNPQSLAEASARAYQAKNYKAFLELQKRIFALEPGNTGAVYNLACAQALNGHAAESVQLLDKLLALKIDLNADTDSDFKAIDQSPEWATFKKQLAELRQPIVHSTVAFTLPDKNLVPAGIAVDPQTGDTYIASVRERKILKRTKDGVVSDFATRKDGLMAVFDLVLDPVRKQLIASTAALSFMQDFKKEDEGKAGICIFDLNTGKLARSVFLSPDPEHHLLSTMAEDKDGNIFVTDYSAGAIYRLRRASNEIELYISSVEFHAPQALALSADERTLYVADYVDGIWAAEVLSTDLHHLDTSPDVWVGGITGLRRVGNSLIALQTAAKPNRLVRMLLDPKAERITSVETLESNLPSYAGPVLGSISGDDLFYIANSQIGLGNAKTGAFDEAHAQPVTVLRLPLGK